MTSRLHRRFGPWVLHHSYEFKWHYLGAFICLFVLQLLQAELPQRIRTLTKEMTGETLSGSAVWIFVGLAIGILIFRTLSRLLFFYPARVQQKTLRLELLGYLEKVPPERYRSRSQGQVFQILFDDINNLRAFIGFGMLQICNLVIAAWVLIPKVNQTDSYLWPAFIPLFSSVFLFSAMTLINQRYFKKMMEKKGEVQQYIIESYEAKQTIKNFHREENFIQGFVRASAAELSLFFKSSVAFAISGPYVKLGLGASLLWGGLLIKARGGDASDLVFFGGFLYLFLEPVQFLSWVAVVLSQGLAAWGRVKELYTEVQTPSPTEVEVKDLVVTVNEREVSLGLKFWDRPIKLGLDQGRWTVIFGETGSGKSYLLGKLATTLILKGHKVSMVQQEPHLFNDTVEENIFLGKVPSASDRALALELVDMFQLDSLAGTPEAVLALEVGENGKRLSGGQMKRVALIRSLLSESKILIWDDPFSSVDIILERRIIKALKSNEKFKDVTFILSSHRLTTIRLAEQAIYVDKSLGIRTQGQVEQVLKETHVQQFFKEQLLEAPLA